MDFFAQIDQSRIGCSGQPMEWLLYWAVCKPVRKHLRIRFPIISMFNNFLWEDVKVEKAGGKGGLEIGIYLSSACVLMVCGLWDLDFPRPQRPGRPPAVTNLDLYFPYPTRRVQP